MGRHHSDFFLIILIYFVLVEKPLCSVGLPIWKNESDDILNDFENSTIQDPELEYDYDSSTTTAKNSTDIIRSHGNHILTRLLSIVMGLFLPVTLLLCCYCYLFYICIRDARARPYFIPDDHTPVMSGPPANQIATHPPSIPSDDGPPTYSESKSQTPRPMDANYLKAPLCISFGTISTSKL